MNTSCHTLKLSQTISHIPNLYSNVNFQPFWPDSPAPIMSDPPSPISPLATTPATPSPKAANTRTFWRDIVRRVSRTPSTIPNSDPSTISPEPVSTPLVEINVAKRQQSDAVRRHPNDPVNASAFDDLPPAEVYDPAWNTNPLRGEAGRLGSKANGPRAPVLPNAFTIKSSDLDDDDDDDDNTDDCDDHSQTLSPPEPRPAPTRLRTRRLPNSVSMTESAMIDQRSVPRDLRPRRSMVWRKQTPATPLVKSRSTMKKVNAFESPTTPKATIDHLLTIMRGQLEGEIVSIKNAEIRARVPIRVKDSTTNVVVISIDGHANSCRVSVRRSFADSFRISTEDFDKFCSDLQRRFHALLRTASSS